MTRRQRYQRGTLRLERGTWVLRYRGEAGAPDVPRPQLRLRIGRSTEYKTRKAARLEADRRLTAMGMAQQHQGRREKFIDWLTVYLQDRVAVLKPSTRAAFKTYGVHLRRELQGLYVDEVTVGACQRVIAQLAGRHLARPTILAVVKFLRRMLTAARQEGIAANLIGPREVTLPKETRPRTAERCFSIEETARILVAAPWPWRALYALMAFLGLRVGEALGITWSDIDLGRRVVRVRQQANRGEISTTKTSGSSTVLPLPAALAAILTEYQDHCRSNAAGLLFESPRRRGKPYHAHSVASHHLGRLLKQLNIPHAGFHAWRHALATEAFRTGSGASAVKQLLRHGNIQTTLRYSAVSFDDLVQSSDAVALKLAAALEEKQRCGASHHATAAIPDAR